MRSCLQECLDLYLEGFYEEKYCLFYADALPKKRSLPADCLRLPRFAAAGCELMPTGSCRVSMPAAAIM